MKHALALFHLNPHKIDLALAVVMGLALVSILLPKDMHAFATLASVLHVFLWWIHE